MTIEDFITNITNRGYEWKIEEHEGQKGFYLRKNDNVIFASQKGIESQDWNTLRKAIPSVYHVTRIVGYLSRIENWNKSKLSELRDRGKGNYGI